MREITIMYSSVMMICEDESHELDIMHIAGLRWELSGRPPGARYIFSLYNITEGPQVSLIRENIKLSLDKRDYNNV